MTLIELIIALFISTLILSSLTTIYVAARKVLQTQEALATMIDNSHIAMHFLRSDIKRARDEVTNHTHIQPYSSAAGKAGSEAFTVYHADAAMNTYFIKNTGRRTLSYEPIDALYRLDDKGHQTELVEGVSDMKIRYAVLEDNQIVEHNAGEINNKSQIVGVSIMLTFVSLNAFHLQKNEYMYVSL